MTARPIYVIAGTLAEFAQWVGEQPTDHEYRYLRGPEQLLGLDTPTIRCVGRYWESSVYWAARGRGMVAP